MKQKGLQLFDEAFILDFFEKNFSHHYPDFKKINSLKIIPHKKFLWEKNYHLVIEYQVKYENSRNEEKELSVFCSAHAEEGRKNVFDNLTFLWGSGFDQGDLIVPQPLFYADDLGAVFYRGVPGHNLYHYIRTNDRAAVLRLLPLAARWFARLHALPVPDSFLSVSRIKTVLPGVRHILGRIERDYGEFLPTIQEIYDRLTGEEERFLDKTARLWAVHGDAHPENVIRAGGSVLAVIDFTDLCLSDFARDLGSFTQQLEFMIGRKLSDQDFADQAKTLFLAEYYQAAGFAPDSGLNERIKIYFNWTAMRTAMHYFIKHQPEVERAVGLVEKVRQDLGL